MAVENLSSLLIPFNRTVTDLKETEHENKEPRTYSWGKNWPVKLPRTFFLTHINLLGKTVYHSKRKTENLISGLLRGTLVLQPVTEDRKRRKIARASPACHHVWLAQTALQSFSVLHEGLSFEATFKGNMSMSTALKKSVWASYIEL